MNFDEQQQQQQFKLLIIHLNNFLKLSDFIDHGEGEEKVNVFRLIANVRKNFLIIYRYKNIQVQVNLRRRTNKVFLQMENNEIRMKQQIIIDLNRHFNQQFKLDNDEELNGSLNNLINTIKHTINNSIDPSSYSTAASSLISTMPLRTGVGDDLESYDNLFSLKSNAHELQLTSSSLTHINSNKIDMDDDNPDLGHIPQRSHMQFQNMNFHLPPRRYHPYHHHCMRPSHLPLELNDGQPPQLPQSIYNIDVPTTMSTQQSSLLTDPLFRAIYDDIKRLP